MLGHRKEIPRCQVSVFCGSHPDLEADCGEPSVAVWNWEGGEEKHNLYVCETHDEGICEQEENKEEGSLN